MTADEMRALLQDYGNTEEVGTRFPLGVGYDEKPILCPVCKQQALADNWPPNYWHSSGGWSGIEGEESHWYTEGSIKCVCLPCKIAFRYFQAGDGNTWETRYSEQIPLVEKEGKWLTPHDVWREEYKQEHGEYPQEAYA